MEIDLVRGRCPLTVYNNRERLGKGGTINRDRVGNISLSLFRTTSIEGMFES